MNKENLRRVADAMETHAYPVGYNQRRWQSQRLQDRSDRGCGTTMCIAGWAEMVRIGNLTFDAADAVASATAFLGLTASEERKLFHACPYGFSGPVLAEAVAVLRHAAEHDVINWAAVRQGDAA